MCFMLHKSANYLANVCSKILEKIKFNIGQSLENGMSYNIALRLNPYLINTLQETNNIKFYALT